MKKSGFTLLEIGVVLTIIGLIVGGILVGKDMLRQSKIMSSVSDVQRLKNAVGTFYERYQQLPGDMSAAQTYWPSCTDVAGNPCNGNGNGTIYHVDSEELRAWQHLSLAGMLEDNFTGVKPATGNPYVEGVNMPTGPMPANRNYTFYRIGSAMPSTGDTVFTEFKHFISLTSISNTFTRPYGPAVRPGEAYLVDKKYDNGNALSGRIGTIAGVNPDTNVAYGWCSDGGSAGNGNYTTFSSATEIRCRMYFFFDKSEL